jgi:hypothetical protein
VVTKEGMNEWPWEEGRKDGREGGREGGRKEGKEEKKGKSTQRPSEEKDLGPQQSGELG